MAIKNLTDDNPGYQRCSSKIEFKKNDSIVLKSSRKLKE
jgi:hypothetical protein